jgi:hypothetical protein
VNNLNLEILIYLPNILVTVELYGLRVSITIKEHEKDRWASAPPVFSLKLRPWMNCSDIKSLRKMHYGVISPNLPLPPRHATDYVIM